MEDEVEEGTDAVSTDRSRDDVDHARHHERVVQEVLTNDGGARAVEVHGCDIRRIVRDEEVTVDGRQHA